MQDFTSLGLPQPLMRSLEAMKFTTPTPIQAQSIPAILQGKDILGSAATGTGKTGAFGIPLVASLLSHPRGTGLILTPTRELAIQVQEALEQMLGKYSAIKTALLIGGDSMPKQTQALRMRPRVIVGTPGRINDHLERGTLMLHDANYVVLDETDRMLDMGFLPQIERIMKFLPAQRQTLMFSATLPDNIVKMSQRYLKDPVRVSVGSSIAAAPKIKQEILRVTDDSKYPELLKQVNARNGSIVVFVRTKWGTEKLAKRLRKDKHSAEAIHGDLRQNQRERVIDAFREMKYRILVATDIAARGLDIPHIEHVINYDLPQVPEDYIHRIGRTARAGAEGSAICLVAPQDEDRWYDIQKMMNPGEKPQPRRPHGGGHSAGNSQHKQGGAGGKRRRRFRGGQRPQHGSQPKAAA